ncbi:MAG TPA: CHAT domain-containing tetratricopeptide repeat protein [Bryobacteraceae bacterium]|nr:CHAT domain-containing tetratricopeptide repeat protein [Bryobacteraceae bacterium]
MLRFVQVTCGIGIFLGTALSQNIASQDWASLDRQAEEVYTKGDLKEAIRIARLAVDASSDPKQLAHSMDRVGFFEYTSGSLKDGESFLRQALELRRTKLGIDTADYAESANDLALFCRDSAKLPEARVLAEQAVAIYSRVLGPLHPRVAESLNTLASIYALSGEYDLAIIRFEEALTIHESQSDPKDFSEEYGTLCINLAGTYQRVGSYAKSEASFQKGLDVLRKKPGINHPAYSASLVAFAYLQADLGHYSAAEKLYNESGVLLREQLGEQHPVYTAFLNNRAALYAALGNLALAESDYRKALELKRKIYGSDAVTIGSSLRNLARLVSPRNPKEGERLFNEAVDLYARSPKAPPFDYASALLGLAEAQRNRGDLAAAGETLQHASEVITRGLGTKHPLYAAVLRDLALVDQSTRKYSEAERQLQEAIAIIKETQGENHPDLAPYLERLAVIYDEAGDYRAAEPLYRRSLDISDRALADMLTVGSERNKAAVGANLGDPIPMLLSFQRRAGDQLPPARALAFEAVARRKGRVLDQLHDWGQSLRENPNAGVRDRFNQRQAMLECQASLTIALGYRDLRPALVGTCALLGTDLESRYERLLHDLRTNWTAALSRQALEAVEVLKQHIETLEASLSRETPQFASAIRPVRLEDIRARLQPDELLIEFVVYRDSAAGNRRYGAFLLGRSGRLEWADLGTSGPIDRAVQDLIAAANDWSVSLSFGEKHTAASAEETAQEALGTLTEKLSPVIAWLESRKDVQRLRVASDGMLNLLPLGALFDRRGHFLIERFSISYISASRDLASPSVASLAMGPTIIAVSPGAGAKPPLADNRAASAFRAERLERLEGAEVEARNVQRWIPTAQMLGEGEATEQRVKQLHHPALLHIIGHGIVRGNEDCQAGSTSPACQLAGIEPAARVTSLSAIVLEEAYGRGGDSPQDGLLTALELQTLDLQGSEMLVLSQCRMADGVPSSGEGVFGMRRAAAIAGVKTFVAPLWKIADSTEQTLMNHFYKELSAGKGRAEALRQAQLHLLGNARTASFLQWAPVILSGDPGPLPKELFVR